MKLDDIKNEGDIITYIEGCINDLESGISTKDETHWAIIHLISWVVQKDRKNQIDKLETMLKEKA